MENTPTTILNTPSDEYATAIPSAEEMVDSPMEDSGEDIGDFEEILGGGGSLESGVEWTWSYPVRHHPGVSLAEEMREE